MKRLAVFCGSSTGLDGAHAGLASELGRTMAREGIGLVYGGAAIGLMGRLADAVLEHGGSVTGIIPDFFSRKEIAHQGLQELIFVPSMHERKLRMAELADGFIAMPGGFGTLDELFEIITWAQLDLHRKPVGMLNSKGYFNLLLGFIDHMFAEGFLRDQHHSMLIREEDPQRLIDRMRHYRAPEQSKWIGLIKA